MLRFCFIAFMASHCCSIVIPPVTLTGSKTAVEKQIIGEQNELEKDVWMISSAKTSSSTKLSYEDERKVAKKNKDNTYIYTAYALLDVHGSKLEDLKSALVVGENNKGLLSVLINNSSLEIPIESKKKYDPKLKDDVELGIHYRRMQGVVKEINRARRYLVKGYILNQKKVDKDFAGEEDELILQQKQKYHDATLKGQYVQDKTGTWLLK